MYSDLDMTPEEIADTLEQERKNKMRLHKLTITKVTNKSGFVRSIVNLFPQHSFAERVKMVDNLPIIDDEMWAEPELIKQVLSPHCEYTYERIPFPGCSEPSIPPWESPIYIEAKKWMDSLPEEDKEKVRILIQGSMPWGCP